jgi:hypothetical protein
MTDKKKTKLIVQFIYYKWLPRFSAAIQFYDLQPVTPAKNVNNFNRVFDV